MTETLPNGLPVPSRLRVLRKIKGLSDMVRDAQDDPSTRNPLLDALYLDRKAKFFRQGYIDNDLPRPSSINIELVDELTEDFALFSRDEDRIVGKFKTLKEAEAARDSAKVTFNYNIEVPEASPASAATS